MCSDTKCVVTQNVPQHNKTFLLTEIISSQILLQFFDINGNHTFLLLRYVTNKFSFFITQDPLKETEFCSTEAQWKSTSIDELLGGEYAGDGVICCWREAGVYCGEQLGLCSGLGGGGTS
jgi:hypothetical protein